MSLKRILIVDDEEDIVKVVKMYLEYHRYEVITAGDGHEGLERAKTEKPGLRHTGSRQRTICLAATPALSLPLRGLPKARKSPFAPLSLRPLPSVYPVRNISSVF